MLLDFSERMTGKQFSYVLVVQFVKSRGIWTIKVNFRCQKISESFQLFFSLENINLGPLFLITSIFKPLTIRAPL